MPFWEKLIIAVVIYLVVLVAGLAVFWNFLDVFESHLPEKYASDLFEHISNFDKTILTAENLSEDIEISEFESAESFDAYIDSLSDAELELRPVSSGMGDDKKYTVTANGKKLADFVLHPSEQKAAFGVGKWEYGKITTFADRKYAAVVEVLPESTLTVNGMEVSDSYIAATGDNYNVYAVSGLMVEPEIKVESKNGYTSTLEKVEQDGGANDADKASPGSLQFREKYFLVKHLNTSDVYVAKSEEQEPVIITEREDSIYNGHLPNESDELYYRTIRVSGVASIDDITVYDKDGNVASLVQDDDGVYVEQFFYSEKLEKEFSERAYKAAHAYAEFMTNDGSIGEVALYFDKKSQIYRHIRSSEVYWYTTHIGYSFDNEKISEFYPISDTAFVCRYTGTQTVNRTATDKRVMELDLTMYFKLYDNGKYYIYDMVVG